MVTRYKYARMTGKDMSEDLNILGITAGQFSRISGARYENVLLWLDDAKDIPPHIPVLLALLKLPDGLTTAFDVVNFYIEEPTS